MAATEAQGSVRLRVWPPASHYLGGKPSLASLALYWPGPKSLKPRNSTPCLQNADSKKKKNKKILLSHQILNSYVWAADIRLLYFDETWHLVRKYSTAASWPWWEEKHDSSAHTLLGWTRKLFLSLSSLGHGRPRQEVKFKSLLGH